MDHAEQLLEYLLSASADLDDCPRWIANPIIDALPELSQLVEGMGSRDRHGALCRASTALALYRAWRRFAADREERRHAS